MKLLIEVKGNKPLKDYGDNHVIAYDKNTDSYYVTTAESFFAGQNVKINNIKQEIDDTNARVMTMQKELASFENVIQGRINDFLKQYQETNAKLIAMVRELVEAKEE